MTQILMTTTGQTNKGWKGWSALAYVNSTCVFEFLGLERKPLRFSHFYDPKKGRAFRNIGKNHYIPNCKTSICTTRLIFGNPG